MSQKFGLGRGLESLFNENATSQSTVTTLRISEIEPNKNQPRKAFDEQALSDLAQSIKEHGLIQPIVVRQTKSLNYQIIAGERRWRASRIAGLESVPVIVADVSDEECMALAMIENLQREDLNPVEEAKGYKQLMDSRKLTQEQVADLVGKSRPAIANSLRLLKLPDFVLDALEKGEITAGHARGMLTLDASLLEDALALAKNGASVREIERLHVAKPKAAKKVTQPNYYKEVQLALTKSLGRKVKVSKGEKKSLIEIEFYSDKELTEIANLLGKNER